MYDYMETHTTNINDLPIVDTTLPESKDLPETQLNSQANHVIDENRLPVEMSKTIEPPKKVRFNEIEEDLEKTRTNQQHFVFQETHKIVILASLLFFVFYQGKVKNYILNILVVIFGKYIKSEVGAISKLGILFYSLFYCLTLFTIVSTIDISSFNLSF